MVVKLETKDHNQLIKVLQDIPLLSSEDGRIAMLESAGLEDIIPYIKSSDKVFVAIKNLIRELSKHGLLTYDNEALGLFLNTLIYSVFWMNWQIAISSV